MAAYGDPRAMAAAYAADRNGRRVAFVQARAAIEAAMAEAEGNLSNSAVEREALGAAREGLRAALAALAQSHEDVDANLESGTGETSWSFEIRRAELGEPIRVILEQAGTPPVPPAPPAPPALPGTVGGAQEEVILRLGPLSVQRRVEMQRSEEQARIESEAQRDAAHRAAEAERHAAEAERRRRDREREREPN